jgi:uncharacterized protein YaaN involved in tellurite resistance
MSEQANPNQRLQEIESLIAQLINSQKHLLQAQVILTDQQDRSGQLFARLVEFAEGTEQRLQRLTENVDSLAASQAHSDARLDALIAVVDDPVRRNGKPGTSALQ